MAERKITFFPVENGQAVLVSLDDQTHLLFDIKQKPDDEEHEKEWDVHKWLLEVLPKRNDSYILSVFCLSHADIDHCQGFERVFSYGNSETNEELRIIIDELWVTADFFHNKLEGSAAIIQNEAKRRLTLWLDPQQLEKAKEPGNRLVVFGGSRDQDLKKLPTSIRPVAGEDVNTVCGTVRSDFSFFVHWPFREIVDEEKEDRNESSLVGLLSIMEQDESATMLLGGDAGCWIWDIIYKKTEEKRRLNKLKWNVFFVPHHGSYGFFTEKTGNEGRDEARDNPIKSSLEILGLGLDKSWIVCSSRVPKDRNYTDDNPPHIQAVNHYKDCAEKKKGQFICLMQYPNEDKPEPLVLRLTPGGLQEKKIQCSVNRGVDSVAGTPQRWG